MTHLEVSNASRQIMVIIQIILSFIAVIIAVYYYKRFNNLSNSVMIQKRHPEILKIQGITSIIFFLIVYPLMVIDFACLNDFIIYQQEIRRIDTAIFPFFTAAIFLLVLWRFWLIFFDLKHSSSQQNTEWKYHLDPDLVEHNFWLTHKKNYGSPSYTKKFIIIYYISNVFLLCGLYQIFINSKYIIVIHLLSACLHGIETSSYLLLWWKTPAYWDYFFIKKELKMISVGVCICVPVSWILIIFGMIFSPELLLAISTIVGEIIVFLMLLVSFWFIPNKIRQKELKLLIAKQARQSVPEDSVVSSTMNGSMTNINDPNKIKLTHIVRRLSKNKHGIHNAKKKLRKLHHILSNKKTFKIYMQHLAKEFSIECLLFFVEIIQFKFSMKKRFDIINPKAIPSVAVFAMDTPLSSVTPQSIINREGFKDLSKYTLNNDPETLMNESKNVCLKLYHKYVRNGSELETNISYGDRSRLSNLMTDQEFWFGFNIKPNELFCLYDTVAICMFRLMEGSFARFQSTSQFQIACKVMNQNAD
eukprot:535864_1